MISPDLRYSVGRNIMADFNRCSNTSDLIITDMRFVDIDGAPKSNKKDLNYIYSIV